MNFEVGTFEVAPIMEKNNKKKNNQIVHQGHIRKFRVKIMSCLFSIIKLYDE